MASAVMNRQNALAKLEELQARATQLEAKFQEQEAQFQAERSAVATEIKHCADVIAGSNGTVTSASVSAPVLVKKRGRKTKAVAKPAAAPNKRRGRPPGSKNKPKDSPAPAPANAPAPAAPASASGDMKLEDAILHVLAHPKTWRRHVEDLPKGCTGLKVMELAEIVQGEGLWKTDSKNPESQVSQRLKTLREAEKVIRGDQMRYRIK